VSECDTCGEVAAELARGDSPNADDICMNPQRNCGHHCNHYLSDDHCHWCGAEFDGEVLVRPDVLPRTLVHS
jgi:hypothetical protein